MILDRGMQVLNINMEIGHFGAEGYYVDTIRRSKKVIEEYIKNQLQEDLVYKQLSL